jgi:hypothetical protein
MKHNSEMQETLAYTKSLQKSVADYHSRLAASMMEAEAPTTSYAKSFSTPMSSSASFTAFGTNRYQGGVGGI